MERKCPQVVHPCAAYRIAPLPLCLYERTPRRVRCCAIDHCVCRMGLFPAGGPMDALFARPAETFRLVCALGIGHRLRAASVHDVRNHLLYTTAVTAAYLLLAALFYPSARVMSERTDMRKFLEWLEYPGALADSYHSIITQDCHDNADNGSSYNPHGMNHQKQNENEK